MEDQGGRGYKRVRVSNDAFISDRRRKADNEASVDVAEIEEPCAHSVQYGGICVDCGKDMTE